MTQETKVEIKKKCNKCQIKRFEHQFPPYGSKCLDCMEQTFSGNLHYLEFLECGLCGQTKNKMDCYNEFTTTAQSVLCNDCYFHFLELIQPLKRNVEERIRDRRLTHPIIPKLKLDKNYKIAQIDNVTRVVLGEFDNCADASRKTGVSAAIIANVANGRTKPVGEFDWIKIPFQKPEKEKKPIVKREPPKPKQRRTKYRIQQIDKETGQLISEYNTVVNAAKATGISDNTIHNQINGASKQRGPYIWVKVYN